VGAPLLLLPRSRPNSSLPCVSGDLSSASAAAAAAAVVVECCANADADRETPAATSCAVGWSKVNDKRPGLEG
jgi:hypothetical protein